LDTAAFTRHHDCRGVVVHTDRLNPLEFETIMTTPATQAA
jgi:hypothetical protein